MLFVLFLILIVLLIFGPQWWARATFRRYATNQDHIPGTGGELARHLLDRFQMESVKVEKTGAGQDHYDPATRTVRLGPDNHNGKSLTAVAVAAHEVGHAIQHREGNSLLALRTRLAVLAAGVEKFGAAALLLMPLVAVITRVPSTGLLMLTAGLGSLLLATLVHLVTLPVELDASFNKALPILQQGYIRPQDEAAVRRILRAAALTYVAGSLASLLNLWRRLAILRR